MEPIVRRVVASGEPVIDLAVSSSTEAVPGAERTWLSSWLPIKDIEEQVAGVSVVVVEITSLKQAEASLRESEQRYRQLFEAMPQLAVWASATGEGILFNERWSEYTGQSQEEAAGMGWLNVLHPDDLPRVATEMKRAAGTADFYRAEYRLRRGLDGEFRWHLAIGLPVRMAAAEEMAGWIVTVTDIEDQKRVQEILHDANRHLEQRVAERTAQLVEVNRGLTALMQCAQVLLHTTDEVVLLKEVCQIIAKARGDRMVWIGFAEHDKDKTVRPVASAGVVRGYLKEARITWADTARGRGPVGTAIRTGKTAYVKNTRTDPGFRPWRKAALERGYLSCLALPLGAGDQIFGALAIYAPEIDAFESSEQQLLTTLANELAYGIATLRARTDRERLERQLLNISEREQLRISHDLHDGLGQQLAGISFMASSLPRQLERLVPQAAKEAERISGLLKESIQQVRALSRGLHPIIQDEKALMVALRDLAAQMQEVYGTTCLWVCPRRVLIQDHPAAVHLYRIAQEAVHNALNHGKPGHIWIRLEERRQAIMLTIEDDGCGLPAQSSSAHGMGINIMKYRARLIGTECQITRRPHGGTIVTCCWKPVKQPAKKKITRR